jgi:hypothetical protein
MKSAALALIALLGSPMAFAQKAESSGVALLGSPTAFAQASRQADDSFASEARAALATARKLYEVHPENSCTSAPAVSCGQVVGGAPGCLSSTFYLDLWTFSAIAGQAITIQTLSASAYQMLITVQDSSGVLTSTHTAGTAQLQFSFPYTGTFFIGFAYVGNYISDPYTMTISCGSVSTSCQSSGILGMTSSINSQLSASSGTACLGGVQYSLAYGIDATQNVPVVISLNSTFTPFLQISPPGMNSGIFSGIDTAGQVNITYLPAITGRIWVYVSSNRSTPESGSFTLSMSALPPDDPCRRRAVTH